MRLSLPDKSLIFLLMVTIGLITWYQKGMERILAIDLATPEFPIHLIDDRGVGGKSVATFETTDKGQVLACQLSKEYQWPFCEISVKLAEDDNPVDISRFDFIRVRMKASGPGIQNVKTYLLNYGLEYSRPGNSNTRKINQVQYDPSKESYPLDIPLKSFAVPPWWVNEMGLSPLQAAPELDRITHLQIATGDYRSEGYHELLIESIELHGKWLSYGQVASIIIVMWVAFGFLVLVGNIISAQRSVSSERKTKEVLQDINSALSIEKIELQEQANRDHLTGALNRMGLRSHLLHLIARNHRDKSRFSLIFIDIDHFKNINDSYGHDLGDQVLQDFAQLVEQKIRVEYFFGRWGGEEFVLLCPDTNISQAKKVAENLRLIILTHKWPEGLQLSASFGVAEIQKAEDISSLINRADSALYLAKSQGRNRVVVSSDTQPIEES